MQVRRQGGGGGACKRRSSNSGIGPGRAPGAAGRKPSAAGAAAASKSAWKTTRILILHGQSQRRKRDLEDRRFPGRPHQLPASLPPSSIRRSIHAPSSASEAQAGSIRVLFNQEGSRVQRVSRRPVRVCDNASGIHRLVCLRPSPCTEDDDTEQSPKGLSRPSDVSREWNS